MSGPRFAVEKAATLSSFRNFVRGFVMKYLLVFVVSTLIALGSATPSEAQDRDRAPTITREGSDTGERSEDGVRKREQTDRSDRVRTTDANRRRGGVRTRDTNRGSDRVRTSDTNRRADNTTRRGDVVRPTDERDGRDAPWEIGRRTDGDIRRGGPGVAGKASQGNGPPFCRNGNGHPVHGRQWCIDKGWGLGSNRGVWDVGPDDRRIPPPRDRRSILDDILERR